MRNQAEEHTSSATLGVPHLKSDRGVTRQSAIVRSSLRSAGEGINGVRPDSQHKTLTLRNAPKHEA
jgi:hypothetical protein